MPGVDLERGFHAFQEGPAEKPVGGPWHFGPSFVKFDGTDRRLPTESHGVAVLSESLHTFKSKLGARTLRTGLLAVLL